MSNSKLTEFQKNARKSLKREFASQGGHLFSFAALGVTLAIWAPFKGSNTAYVSSSIASADETKFRRKVGEYHALSHWADENATLCVNTLDSEGVEEWAYNLAAALVGSTDVFVESDSEYRFDLDGFDSDGFDRDGFDVYGFDINGFDRDGFDNNGFDINEFDQDGFDRDGFDRYGFDRDGFDRDGFDRDGFDRNREMRI